MFPKKFAFRSQLSATGPSFSEQFSDTNSESENMLKFLKFIVPKPHGTVDRLFSQLNGYNDL